jgi:hypothetical protein
MRLEIAKATRKCYEEKCRVAIGRGEICGVTEVRDQYGTKKVSYCKVCTIQGLEVKMKTIERQLRRIRRS